MMNELMKRSLIQVGNSPEPTYALIDSQSVKTTNKPENKDFDKRKKVKDRKRHIVTDTLGHMLHVQAHAANTHDTVGGCPVFKTLKKYSTLEIVCADAMIYNLYYKK